MGRSREFPTHYKVGVLNGKDVYLHPQMGLSIKRGDRLTKMTSKELKAWILRRLYDDPNIELHISKEHGTGWAIVDGIRVEFTWSKDNGIFDDTVQVVSQ